MGGLCKWVAPPYPKVLGGKSWSEEMALRLAVSWNPVSLEKPPPRASRETLSAQAWLDDEWAQKRYMLTISYT
jgi:hypothetical protein